MKLSTALATFVVLLLTVFLASGYALVSTSDLLDREAKELADAGESARLAEALKSSLLIHNRDTILHSIEENHIKRSPFSEKRVILGLLVESIQRSDSPEEGQILIEVKAAIETYLSSIEEVLIRDVSVVEKYIDISGSVDSAISAIEKLVSINIEQKRDLKVSIDEENMQANKKAFLLIALGSVILLGLTFGIVFMVVRPLSTLSKVVKDYGLGDTAVRAKLFGISEIRSISSNFNSMADRLEERRKDRLRFIASIAHDLRNPIGSMSMASELLLSNCKTEDRELTAIILRQIKTLDRLVGDLLDTTRIESGQLRLEVKSADLCPILTDAVELHKTSTSIHDIFLEMNGKQLVVKCDAERIQQVINNLLSNAIKYSPIGGEIRIDARKVDENVEISVQDQGIGIDANDLTDIFKPFNRSAATKGTIPGIGLGLSVSRNIVEAHGGTLLVDSRLGEGSTFTIRLPAIQEPA